MEPKVIIKKEFKVIGLPCETTLNENRVPDLWDKFRLRVSEIKGKCYENLTMGISEFSSNRDESFMYLACVPVKEIKEIPDGMISKTVPEGKYVVITHKGKVDTDALGETFDYIYDTWLPESDYELDERDDFEVYGEQFQGVHNNGSEIDLYIPIK